jgi:hypothetical protein
MERKSRIRKLRRLYLLPLLFFVGVVGLLYAASNQVCGYKLGGFEIECDCFGWEIKKQDSDAVVSREGEIINCLGLAKNRVCFKQFEREKNARPYSCSEYPYKVRISPFSSVVARKIYPDTKFAYMAELGSDTVLLESKEEVNCNQVEVQGFVEKIKLGGGSNYEGFHLYGEKFRCVD